MKTAKRLVLCWADISGYMAACWRALAATSGVDLRVIAFAAPGNTFSSDLAVGFNCRLLSQQEKNDPALIASLVKEHRPDVLYTSGWFHEPYRKLIRDPSFASVPKWMGVDTPWRGTLRQQLGRITLRSYADRFDRVFVPGERAWQYMRRLGVAESRIRRGLYGVDYDQLAPLYEQRLNQAGGGGWPRRFLFIGRYAQEKGISTLIEAYAKYRAAVSDPWPLTCCGSGALKGLFVGREGIEDLGFRQPGELPEILRSHGVFVLASDFDPWPLVVVESSAAGLPVLCTEACGSAVELVRSYHNGLTVATADVDALAAGMRWMHEHAAELAEMGRRGRELAAAYSAQTWAARWAHAFFEQLR